MFGKKRFSIGRSVEQMVAEADAVPLESSALTSRGLGELMIYGDDLLAIDDSFWAGEEDGALPPLGEA